MRLALNNNDGNSIVDYLTVHNATVSQFSPISGTNLTLVRLSVNSTKGDYLSGV